MVAVRLLSIATRDTTPTLAHKQVDTQPDTCYTRVGRGTSRQEQGTAMIAIQNYVYSQYRKCAEKRGILFNIDAATFLALAAAPCAYCGATNTNTATRKQYAVKVWNYNGIDRVNSDQSYALGNVVACCKLCNAAKTDMNPATFLASDWLKSRISSVKGE